MSKFIVAHIYRRRHLPAARPLCACGLARPVLDRKRDQRAPARAAARECGVFEGASFAICTLPSHPSAAVSSSCSSTFSFPCRPSFPRRPHPFFLPIVVSVRSISSTHTLRLHSSYPSSPFPSPPPPLLCTPHCRVAEDAHLPVRDARDAEAPLDAVRVCGVTHEWYVVFLLCRRSSFLETRGSGNALTSQLCAARFVVLLPSLSSPHRLPPPRPPSPSLPLGAIVDGAFAGWCSQFLGRRITIACVFFSCGRFGGACVVCAGWVELDERVALSLASRPSSSPSGSYPRASARSPPALSVYSSAWGVRPRSAQRSLQLGNMVSSESAQIKATNPRLLAAVHAFANLHTTELTLEARTGFISGAFPTLECLYVFSLVDSPPLPCEPRLGSHLEEHHAAFDEGGGAEEAYVDDEGVHHAAGRVERDVEKASEERSSTA
ncbi:hypothetical protein C8J57DRAFT_1534082 [Mycena rebaudengoi]|nr:hypothetical protein C8J57DRAFT_1534082 [Mycena rebaudengoi]